MTRSFLFLVVLVFVFVSMPAAAQTVSVAPSVIQLQGHTGQSTTQRLTIVNTTHRHLSFTMDAEDVLVRDGRRTFAPAGEVPGSIAATAVFSPRVVGVAPGRAASVTVTLTVPANPTPRAVVALFRSTNSVTDDGRTNVALGTLLTFNLPGSVDMRPDPVRIAPQSASANLAFEQPFTNVGSEPVVVKGLVAIIDQQGQLTGRAPFASLRALPGEQVVLRTDFPGELAPGSYRAVLTFDLGGKPMTVSREVTVQ